MLNLEPLLSASLAIQLHVATACAAAVCGAIVLLKPKGTRWHRLLGRGFVMTMGMTALSSFFIHEIRSVGEFSAIHLLSIGVLVGLMRAVQVIRQGQVRLHRQIMIGTYLGGIVVAGGFTFLPGRLMSKLTDGGGEGSHHIILLVLVIAAVWGLERLWTRFVTKRRTVG